MNQSKTYRTAVISLTTIICVILIRYGVIEFAIKTTLSGVRKIEDFLPYNNFFSFSWCRRPFAIPYFYSLSVIVNTLQFQKIKLSPGNEVWNVWSEMPIPMFAKFYFFNVTNPDKVISGAKPILKEMGPYVYQYYCHTFTNSSNTDYI